MGNSFLLEQTRAFWQVHTSHQLTLEDAREITENVAGFFNLLVVWDSRQNMAEGSEEIKNNVEKQ